MASVAGGSTAQTPPAKAGDPGHPPAVSGGRKALERVLSLREGSIIVVTLVTAIYFAANTSSFFTGSNFKTLLPYFAPFAILAAGEVFVMILGEIDLSIGAM
jgi:simple sugar transport system permease protein